MDWLEFPTGLLSLAGVLVVLLVVAQFIYLLLPDEGEPVDEIRAEREQKGKSS